jgi:hypothetical protein
MQYHIGRELSTCSHTDKLDGSGVKGDDDELVGEGGPARCCSQPRMRTCNTEIAQHLIFFMIARNSIAPRIFVTSPTQTLAMHLSESVTQYN